MGCLRILPRADASGEAFAIIDRPRGSGAVRTAPCGNLIGRSRSFETFDPTHVLTIGTRRNSVRAAASASSTVSFGVGDNTPEIVSERSRSEGKEERRREKLHGVFGKYSYHGLSK